MRGEDSMPGLGDYTLHPEPYTLPLQVRGEDSTSGLVEYDRFEKVIVKALTDRKGEFLRDSETKLMRAFRAFDPENKGYIDGENLKVRTQSVNFAMRNAKTGPTGKL